jgi:hypothetical protein
MASKQQERSLILRDHEVRAVLAGTKTQHRVVIKHPGRNYAPWSDQRWTSDQILVNVPGPFKVGRRLWVKESWRLDGTPIYRASVLDGYEVEMRRGGLQWKPAIHMPRWASRISLEVWRVWPEWLQDISEADAQAEGMAELDGILDEVSLCKRAKALNASPEDGFVWFAEYWDKRHAKKPGRLYDDNPRVWCASFQRVT